MTNSFLPVFRLRQPVLVALAVLVAAISQPGRAQAQTAAANSAALNAKMLKLLGSHTAFTARMEVSVLDKSQRETDNVPVDLSVLDGVIREDLDLTQIKSAELPPALIPTLKESGIDKMVLVVRPDKKLILSEYPRLKAYAETTMTPEDLAAAAVQYKVEKSKIGKETAAGQSCEKSKVILTNDKGEKEEALLWSATGLKDFPVQMQFAGTNSTVILRFKDIKLRRPDAAQFEAPAGMTKYDASKLIAEAVAKATEGKK